MNRSENGLSGQDLQALLQEGLRAHQAGQLADAEAAYRRMLGLDADHADANHLLGVIAHQIGDHGAAVELIGKAIRHDPSTAAYHCNLGNALHELDRLDEAAASQRQAIALNPDYAKAHNNLANVLLAQGRSIDAVASYQKALSIVPDDAETHVNLGIALHELGRLDEAEASYRKALALDPDYAKAHTSLGATLQETGRLDEAVASHQQALALNPDFAEAHASLGNALKEMDRLEDAVASYRKAIALDPDLSGAHTNLGLVLQDQDNASLDAQLNDAVEHHRAGRLFEAEEIYRQILAAEPDYPYALCLLGTIAQATGEYDQAVELISRAIAVKPDYTDAHSNLGIVLQTVERNEEALESFDNALALNPNHAEAHTNKGVSLKSLGRLEDALDSHRKAIALNPDFAEAHYNLSFALLAMGQEQEGLDEFEWRWQCPTVDFTMREYGRPMWDGASDLEGKIILVWPEQGPQDVTIWASAIPELATQAKRCIVATHPKLVSLFARSFPEVEVRPDNAGSSPEPFDFDIHLPMGSLFRSLRTAPISTVPAFLVPDPERVAFWKHRLVDLGPGPYIGISWKSPLITPARSPNYTSINEWAPLFALPARFINLQCGEAGEDLARAERELGITVHNFDDLDLFDGLDDVAALSAALDLSISVSTAVVAITAGVGTPTWVIAWQQSSWNNFLLAPRGPDVTRFERNTGETWDAVFAAMAERLRDLTG